MVKYVAICRQTQNSGRRGDDLRASNKNWVYTVRHRLAALTAMRDALFHILYFLSRLKGT